jgi:WD40 repeat protein
MQYFHLSSFVSLFSFFISVSFHPLGHEISVGFSSSFLTLRLFPNELHIRGEIAISNVTHVSYSNGGHLLAAVSNKNIYVYSTSTCKTTAKFSGHSDHIMSIRWNGKEKN